MGLSESVNERCVEHMTELFTGNIDQHILISVKKSQLDTVDVLIRGDYYSYPADIVPLHVTILVKVIRSCA